MKIKRLKIEQPKTQVALFFWKELMATKIKVSFLVGSLLILILLVGIRLQDNYSNKPTNVLLHTGIVADSNVKIEKSVAVESTENTTSKPSSTNDQEVEWIGDQAQLDQVANWRAERGWYDTSNENQDDYSTYSEETLKQLAANGDLKALHRLARRAPIDVSKPLLTKAATHGSTFALFNLGDHVAIHGGITRNDPEEKKKPVLIEAAAYMVVAAMRGDSLNFKYMGIGSLESRYNMKFNDDDLKLVQARAQQIYNSLESERIALGLGQFDNSIPPVVKARFKYSGIEVKD